MESKKKLQQNHILFEADLHFDGFVWLQDDQFLLSVGNSYFDVKWQQDPLHDNIFPCVDVVLVVGWPWEKQQDYIQHLRSGAQTRLTLSLVLEIPF